MNEHSPVSNEEFLRAIFGDDYIWSYVCGFPDDPSNIPDNRRLKCWGGKWFKDSNLVAGQNLYYCISTFYADAAGIARRRKALFRCTHVVVADDVREKLPIDRVNQLPPPSYIVETSPGSEQYGWILDTPCQDMNKVDNLIDGLIRQGLSPDGRDPGMKSVSRLVRLPFNSANTKASRVAANGGTPPPCRLLEWHPERRYTMEQLATPFLVDLSAKRREVSLDGAAEVPDHPLLQISDIIHIKETITPGRFSITCPWVENHTGQADDGAAIFTNKDGSFGLKCHHGSCQDKTGRHLMDFIEASVPGFREKMRVWQALRNLAEIPGVGQKQSPRQFLYPPGQESSIAKHAQVNNQGENDAVSLADFYAYMPSHQYLFVPTRDLWPASSVNGRLPGINTDERPMKPSAWLDQYRPIEQLVWTPAESEIIRDKVFQISGWVSSPGTTVFNLFRPASLMTGHPELVGPWLDHVRWVYPDDADHLLKWLAQRVQRPGEKINHSIVLGGLQGIGKDTMLEPVKTAVGAWNWSEISPAQMLGRFNGWVKAVVIRISEARDLGDTDRFAFYDHSKTIIAAPPDVIRVDEKHLRETYVANVCGVIITTNNASDGLYLPADDRRHYVTWSPRTKDDFPDDYWVNLYGWYAAGGIAHVCEYLRQYDLSGFDPKAPPPKTPAFWQVVAAGEAPESGELRDVLDRLGNPDAVTIEELSAAAAFVHPDISIDLKDKKIRRTIPHRMERVGYVNVRNDSATDGLFVIRGKRQAVYAKRQLTVSEQLRAAKTKS